MPTELCHAICHKIGACWRLSVITMVMLMVVRGGCRAPPSGWRGCLWGTMSRCPCRISGLEGQGRGGLFWWWLCWDLGLTTPSDLLNLHPVPWGSDLHCTALHGTALLLSCTKVKSEVLDLLVETPVIRQQCFASLHTRWLDAVYIFRANEIMSSLIGLQVF